MSDPVKQVTNAARGVSWNIIALAAVLPLLFGLLIWQLADLDPITACKLVGSQGVPPGNHCFELLKQAFGIKGNTIYMLVGTIAIFIIVLVVAAVKAVVGLAGPGGLSLNVSTKDEGK